MKRPIAMLILGLSTAVGLGACSNDPGDGARRLQEQAEVDRADAVRRAAEADAEKARQAMVAAQAEQRELGRQLTELTATATQLAEDTQEVEQALAAAKTQADRDRLAAQRTELARRRAEAKRRIDAARVRVKSRCPPEQPLC